MDGDNLKYMVLLLWLLAIGACVFENKNALNLIGEKITHLEQTQNIDKCIDACKIK